MPALAVLVLLAAGHLLACLPAIASEQVHWLLAVDTSFSMRKKQETTASIIRELSLDEFNGLIREGEQLKLWTFRDQLFTNVFQQLAWTSADKELLGEKAAKFIQSQKFTRRTRLPAVIDAIQNEAFKHPTLVAIILTDGDDAIRGTPFDGALNGDFLLYRANLRRANLPFVLMMVYQKGFCVAARVHPGVGKITFPLNRPPQVQELLKQVELSPTINTNHLAQPEPVSSSSTNLISSASGSETSTKFVQPGSPLSPPAQPLTVLEQVDSSPLLSVALAQMKPEAGSKPKTTSLEVTAADPDVPEADDGQLRMSSSALDETPETSRQSAEPVTLAAVSNSSSDRSGWKAATAGIIVLVSGTIYLFSRRRRSRSSIISESLVKK